MNFRSIVSLAIFAGLLSACLKDEVPNTGVMPDEPGVLLFNEQAYALQRISLRLDSAIDFVPEDSLGASHFQYQLELADGLIDGQTYLLSLLLYSADTLQPDTGMYAYQDLTDTALVFEDLLGKNFLAAGIFGYDRNGDSLYAGPGDTAITIADGQVRISALSGQNVQLSFNLVLDSIAGTVSGEFRD